MKIPTSPVAQLQVLLILLALVDIAGAGGKPLPGDLPELEFPRSVEVVSVASDMIRNGLPMRIYSFKSHQRIDQVIRSVSDRLSRNGFTVGQVQEMGEMKTLGISDSRHFINVQGQRARHGHGSKGFVVLTPRPDIFKPEMTSPSVPVPEGVTLLSHEIYRDGPRTGETYLGFSERMASDVGASLVGAFQNDGWQSASDQHQPQSTEVAVYRILKKGNRECRLISMDQTFRGQNMATVNVTCHD